MNKQSIFKIVFTFIITFAIAFVIVGYIKNTMFVQIDWLPSATVWDRFIECYIRTFSLNLMPTLIIAIVTIIIVGFVEEARSGHQL